MPFEIAPGDQYRIEFTASASAQAALQDVGRTEDVKFSPDNRRLALAGFLEDKIVVFDVDIAVSAAGTRVALTEATEISSPSLQRPHGLAFIDDATLVVANRAGDAPVFRLPPSGGTSREVTLSPLQTLRSDQTHRLRTPGSVAVSRIDDGLYDVLICNNYAHHVTRHVLESKHAYASRSNQILLSRGLRLPDGVAVSRNRRWIAISNHNTHRVLLYEYTPQLDRRSAPVGILRNLNFPHGVCFTADDNFIVVADAGAPCVNVYATEEGDWNGTRDPVCSVRVMDDAIYRRGRFNPQEGGPKGIDIDRDWNLLVATCAHQPLAFFDLPALLELRATPPDWRKRALRRRVDSSVANLGHLIRHIRRIVAAA